MSKKSKQHQHKPHIKQKAFADRNYTSIEALTRSKGQLDSPFRKLSGVNFSSWYSDFLPNSLWACILSSLLNREDYLALFRQTIGRAREIDEQARPRALVHNHLASTSIDTFDHIFGGVFANSEAKGYLRALRLIDCLPDAHHWERTVEKPNPEKDSSILVHAVADNFDHQNERATDIRWMKVMHEIVCGKIQFSDKFEDILEDFRLYPNSGDMKRVRPHIRAMEMSIRQIEGGSDHVPIMGETFWREMKSKTQCILPSDFAPPTMPSNALRDEILIVMEQVQHHFDDSLLTTNVDARHDGAFGLVLFAMSYLTSLAAFYGHDFPYSRTILRSIVEAFITLEYLGTKDDPSLWEQYRRYGAGQAKLAFLKNIREDEVPEFFDLQLMENLANEDMWLEFEDIRIGNWAKTDLRSMAQASGAKDVYDRYYDWASGYAHGHWIAVRETAFVNCLNPLHRYHRIPGPPLSPLPSVLPDGAKLVNRMLDRLNALYPPFKPRLSTHKKEPIQDKENTRDAQDEPNAESS